MRLTCAQEQSIGFFVSRSVFQNPAGGLARLVASRPGQPRNQSGIPKQTLSVAHRQGEEPQEWLKRKTLATQRHALRQESRQSILPHIPLTPKPQTLNCLTYPGHGVQAAAAPVKFLKDPDGQGSQGPPSGPKNPASQVQLAGTLLLADTRCAHRVRAPRRLGCHQSWIEVQSVHHGAPVEGNWRQLTWGFRVGRTAGARSCVQVHESEADDSSRKRATVGSAQQLARAACGFHASPDGMAPS